MNECNYNSSTENDNNKSIKRMQKSTWIAPHTWFCDYLCCFLLALGHYFQILGVSFEPASSKLSLKIQVAILLVTLF
jgi:siderophore synthetase component